MTRGEKTMKEKGMWHGKGAMETEETTGSSIFREERISSDSCLGWLDWQARVKQEVAFISTSCF